MGSFSGVDAVSTSLDEVRRIIVDRDLDWVAGETTVSLMSAEEYEAMCALRIPEGQTFIAPVIDENWRTIGRGSFDWRDFNGVSPVKNQANCGSCWAFCTVAMLESYVMIVDGVTPDLSEQQLVSCNSYGYDCGGGWLDCVSYFVNPGMADESCMPYQASNLPCAASGCEKIAIADDWSYTGDSVSAIKAALVDGPVACAVYASDAMSYYSGGCFSWGTTSSVNHGVLIVGYDDSDCSGDGAWIVKNSWGTGWGENGFFRIKYGDSAIGYGSTRISYSTSQRATLAISDYAVEDSVIGDGDGYIDPGESLDLMVSLGNTGNIPATGVGAVLTCSQPEIIITQNFATWPTVPAGQQKPASSRFKIQIPDDFPVGKRLEFNLAITCNEGASTDSIMTFSGAVDLVYWNSFEGSTDENWTHSEIAVQDDWQRGTPNGTSIYDPDSAPHGTKIWGNDLGPNGWNGEYKPDVHNTLTSPEFTVTTTENVHLNFMRWLTVEGNTKDKARILINETVVWENPVDTDLMDTEWVDVDLDISSYIQPDTAFQVTFELQTDATGEFGGWNIDDLTLFSILPDSEPEPGDFPVTLKFVQNQSSFTGGDTFDLTLTARNLGDAVEGFLFVVLQYGDAVWFYPTWSSDVTFEGITLDALEISSMPVLNFDVPETMPACGPFNMYGLMIQAESYDFLTDLAATTFEFM